MDSILTSIKKMLGLDSAYTAFDTDIIIHINSAISVLAQMGVGQSDVYSITDDTATWEDYLGAALPNINMVKTYIYLKVRVVFDPPSSSFVLDAFNKQIAEMEWRMNVEEDV